MPNKITYGLEQVHIALLTDPDTPAYGVPVAIPGAVKFTPEPQGAETKLYADDGVYYIASTNDGYKATLEMALLPDAVLEDLFGWRIDANGMLVEIADGTPAEFALLGQIQGDSKNRRFVYYRCRASRVAKEHATKGENIDAKGDAISLTIIPITIGTEKVVRGVIELSAANEAVYNAFFAAVVLPDSAANKTALAAAIALAGTLVQASYTAGSWATMQTALTAAQAVNADPTAVQPEIDAAEAALGDAILALVPV